MNDAFAKKLIKTFSSFSPLVKGLVSPYQGDSGGRKKQLINAIVIIILVILLICAIAFAVHFYLQDVKNQKKSGTVEPHIAHNKSTGEVVSDHGICSQIGR